MHIPPDKAFLHDLDDEKNGWRIKLAKDIKKYHPDFSAEFITQAVQLILDRFIFIKVLSDREIEEDYIQKIFYNLSLKAKVEERKNFSLNKNADSQSPSLQAGVINLYDECKDIFEQLDKTYNGSIFLKRNELDIVKVSNKTLLEILKDLLPQNSRYNFKVIPIEILGTIYEQFLGKVVVTTDKRASIVEKGTGRDPSVRKAGGVYYTPDYIVNYIVDKTVGEKLRNLTLQGEGIEGLKQIKICDPACGSGSFLLAAFNALIKWTIEYYSSKVKIENVKAGRRPALTSISKDERKLIYLDSDGQIRLTSKIKREILRSCIYGVDIDAQAVEVTKMSLSLKALEDTRHYEVYNERTIFHTTILPSLEGNIKCGNSLISSDIYENELLSDDKNKLSSLKLEKKIKPLNYQLVFKEIFNSGGFDCIVMNPPWGYDFSEFELSYLRNKNKEIIVRMIDSFMYFVYQGAQKIKKSSLIGMIVPDVILYQTDNEKLRKFLLENFIIKNIVNTGNVFEQVVRPSAIIIIQKDKTQKNIISINDLAHLKDYESKKQELNSVSTEKKIEQNIINSLSGSLFVTKNPEHYIVTNKIINLDVCPLEHYIDDDGIQRGVSPDLKEAFIVSSKTIKDFKLEKKQLRKVLTGGKQVKRYYIEPHDSWLIYTKNKDDFSELPNIKNYINQFKNQITCTEVRDKKHSLYALHRAREEKIFLKKQKFLGVITEDEIILSLDFDQTFATDGLYLFGIKEIIDPYCLLGILNSKLYIFIYRLLSMEKGRALAQVKPTLLLGLPIINMRASNSELCNRIANIAKSIAQEYLRVDQNLMQNERERVKNKINSLLDMIDSLVYQLYELTPDEIKIVKGEK